MFYTVYYTLLAFFLLASFFVFSKTKTATPPPISATKRLFNQLNRTLLAIFTLFFVTYQVLLWAVPKGKELHESLRLLPHSTKLGAISTKGIEEVRYPFGNHPQQYLILYTPQKEKITQDRIIYFVHGGAWRYGSPELYKPVAKYFTDRGYAVFMTAYRLAPAFHYAHMREDLNFSFKKCLEVLKKKGWQNKKIILMGDSAGANLAGLLLYDRENLRKIGAKQSQFDSFVSFVGALDTDKMHRTGAFEEFTKGYDADILKKANPVTYLQADEDVPVLAFHGTSDGFVDYECSESFVKNLNKIHPNLAKLVTIEDGTHISVGGEWLYEDNEVKHFFEKWLKMKEQQLEN